MTETGLKIWQDWGAFAAIIVGTLILGWVFNRLFKRFIKRSSLVIRNDPTNYQFLRHALTGLIYVLGFGAAVYSVPNLRHLANPLLGGAGILAVAVGFASQHALGNVISGIFIVIFKPFRVNDRLRIRDSMYGMVEDITLRHTVIRDFENRRILIPNSVISDEILINSDFGDDRICKWLEMIITHDSDIDTAREIMIEEALNHPLRLDVRTLEEIKEGKPPVSVRVISIDPLGVKLRAWIWVKDTADAFSLTCDLLESLKKRFDQTGIKLPVIQRCPIGGFTPFSKEN